MNFSAEYKRPFILSKRGKSFYIKKLQKYNKNVIKTCCFYDFMVILSITGVLKINGRLFLAVVRNKYLQFVLQRELVLHKVCAVRAF